MQGFHYLLLPAFRHLVNYPVQPPDMMVLSFKDEQGIVYYLTPSPELAGFQI
jgi:hypothetical protein